MQQEYALGDGDFRRIADLIMKMTGIVIDNRKRAFIHGRLGRRLRILGLNDFGDYCRLLDGAEGASERDMLVNAVTTNHTAFFREPHHFDYLAQTVLPAVLGDQSERHHRLRIWSAGCSTGEEPYSLAMTLSTCASALAAWDVKILATDLDTNVLAHADAGVYDAERAQSIPVGYRNRHLSLQADGHVAMDDELRSLIAFKPLNLLEAWPMSGPFDIIFCRNVVIYFDKATQGRLFERFAEILRPNGWLFIGHSETLQNVSDRFQLVGRTIYQRTK